MLPPTAAASPAPDSHAVEFDVRRLWSIVRRRWQVVLGALLVSMLAGYLSARLATPRYEANAMLRIDDSEQSSVPILADLKALTGQNEVATVLQVLKTRRSAEAVVDSLQLQVGLVDPVRFKRSDLMSDIQAGPLAPWGSYDFVRKGRDTFVVTDRFGGAHIAPVRVGDVVELPGARFRLRPAARDLDRLRVAVRTHDAAADTVRQGLTVTRPEHEASVLIASYSGTDPEIVRDVPNVLLQRFIARRVETRRAGAHSTVLFIKSQIDTLALQLSGAEESLRSFRQSSRVVDPATEATMQVSKLADLVAQRDALEAERSALSALLNDLKTTPASGGASAFRRLLAFPTLFRNNATADMLRTLVAADDQRAALMVRRKATDPDVIALTNRVHDLEDQVRGIVTSYVAGLTNQVAATNRTLQGFNAMASTIPAKDLEFARLSRSSKVLSDVYTMLQTRLKEAEISQAVEDVSAEVADQAATPIRPVWPRHRLVLLLAILVGLTLGVGLASALEWLDNKVHTHADVEAVTGLGNVGFIPHIETTSTPRRWDWRQTRVARIYNEEVAAALVAGRDPRSVVTEAYRALRTNILFARPDHQPPRTIMFTSPGPGDGKTTTIANLATTLSQQGQRVLVIDGDLRRGMLHRMFNVTLSPGLSELLGNQTTREAAIRHVDLGALGRIDLITAGAVPFNPTELLGSSRFAALLASVVTEYDTVLIDTPPVNLFTDAAVLALKVDAVLLVARANKTLKGELAFAFDSLKRIHAPVLGTVLNDFDAKREAAYGSGRYSYYQYGAEAYAAYDRPGGESA